DACHLVGQRDRDHFVWLLGQQLRHPRVFVGMRPRVSDDRRCSHDQKSAQIPITLFRYAAEPLLATSRILSRNEPDPSSALASRLEGGWVGYGCRDRGGAKDADSRNGFEPSASITLAMLGVNVALELADLLLQSCELVHKRLQRLPHWLGQCRRLNGISDYRD